MRVCEHVRCEGFPCQELLTERYTVPEIDVDPDTIRLLMISEAAPADPEDDIYAAGDPFHLQTTRQAFCDAGVEVGSLADILALGAYMTTAVKCAKTGYTIKAGPIRNCSHLLEQEIALFPNTVAILLMGDVAIRGLNYVARRSTGKRAIPSGSTYKIRGDAYHYGAARVFPSYLQAGKSFFIEKSKRRMIAEDIAAAMRLLE